MAQSPEAGSAVVEFLGLALVLLIPLIYLVITLAAVQGGAYAAAGAADQASKVYIQQQADGNPTAAAQQAAAMTLQDFSIPAERGQVTISCSDGSCATPGSLVSVHVSVRVPLPLLPHLFGTQLSIATVEFTAVQAVSEFP